MAEQSFRTSTNMNANEVIANRAFEVLMRSWKNSSNPGA
jgi:aspartate ammonia-lyase